jgi:hypothetical protein
MQSHLATPKRLDDPRLVGTPLEVQLPASQYRSEIDFVQPGPKEGVRFKIARNADKENDLLTASVGLGLLEDRRNTETDRAGIYEAWPVFLNDTSIDLWRWALNVDPEEGNLARLNEESLLKKIEPLRASYHLAEQYQQGEAVASGYNLSLLVMGVLLALLVGEQALAYSASYHPLRAAVGGRA